MNDAEIAGWIEKKAFLGVPTGMGAMEKAVDRACLEARRLALQHMVQEMADHQPLICPKCKGNLNVDGHKRKRGVTTVFGPIIFYRGYGFCPQCGEYFYPADIALGLHDRAPASPRVQEICALTTLRAPAGQAEEDVLRLTGIELAASTLHREARRQGEKALALRDADEHLTQTPEGVAELAARAKPVQKHTTLIIEIDAWNIRERDNWGKTKAFRKAGKDTERWHWVYTATIFRLDQRGTTKSGRPVISERGYVATRRGLDSFQRQVYAEAILRGLLDAEIVLIIADGAIWIWNIANDRFKGAMQRVDLRHVQEHLWNLAGELHGQGSVMAQEWVRPYLRWLENRKDGALDVIEGLEQMQQTVQKITKEQREAIRREINYFTEHKDRMDYKTGKALGQPVGSGAIESTCSQYQRRFKLTGQFWSLSGDEAFLALSTLHRNARWHLLFPHDSR